MALYKIILQVEGSRIDAVEKKAKAAFGDDVRFVRKVDLAKSRADRLAAIAEDINGNAEEIEELKSELEEWKENLPENLQDGDKAGELDEAIQQLEELKDNIEGLDFESVSFPSMF